MMTTRKGRLLLLIAVSAGLLLGTAALIQTVERDGVPLREPTLREIMLEPARWEGTAVRLEGVVEAVSLGIIQPFDYWLCDTQNRTIRVGLRWLSNNDLSGRSVTVVGVVKKGTAWVHPDYPGWSTYYIEAASIAQD